MKKFLPAIVFACISLVGFVAHHAAVPLGIERSYESLEPVGQDVLRGDFEPGFLLKINKDVLLEFQVGLQLPDGRELPRFPRPGALMSAEGEPGFAIARPDVFLRLPEDLRDAPPASVTAVVPIKLKQTVHEVGAVLALLALIGAAAGRGPLAVLRHTQARKQALIALLCAALLPAILAAMIGFARGPFVWLSLFAAVLAAWAFLSLAARALQISVGSTAKDWLQGTGMVAASVLFAFVVAELFLGLAEGPQDTAQASEPARTRSWFQLPDEIVRTALVRKQHAVMPEAWERRRTKIEGTERAYYWHEALHFEDGMGFRRRNGPFPEKGDVYRIMVVGDSLTFGGGIAEEWTYSHLLEQGLQGSHRVEVINLGRSGDQSEDILGVIQGFTPELQPDLVVYGANLNDYLPIGQGGYALYQFPLPEKWKTYFTHRTRLTALLGRGYDGLLSLAGLKHDAYDDIIDPSSPFKDAFTDNLAQMSRYVRTQGLPPILGLVLTPPLNVKDPRSKVIADEIAVAMERTDFDLVSISDPGIELSPHDLVVSVWDGHPNELAHSLIAEALYERIRPRRDLVPFRHLEGNLR